MIIISHNPVRSVKIMRMKNVIAALIALMMSGAPALAFGWDDVKDYASSMWDDVSGCVMGWFASDDTHTNDDSLPSGVAGR